MTTATLTPAADVYRVPAPPPCLACAGIERTACEVCNGSGCERAWFRLPPARSKAYRRVIYSPSCVPGMGRLQLATARKEGGKLEIAEYEIGEFATPWRGRGFAVLKVGEPEPYHLFLGAPEVRCDCPGFSYLAAARANQAAWEAGEEVFQTQGCIHADALCRLLVAGWLDVPEAA